MGFCTKFKTKRKALIAVFDETLQKNAATALSITTALRAILANPVAVVLTDIIPGNLDNIIRERALHGLNKAINALAIVEHCRKPPDLAAKAACFINEIAKRSPELQESLLIKMASIIAKEIDGRPLKDNIFDAAVQDTVTIDKL